MPIAENPAGEGSPPVSASAAAVAFPRRFRDIETDIDVPVDLAPRPSGSRSKIRLLQDGFVILAGLTLHTIARRFPELDSRLQRLGDDVKPIAW